MYPNSQIGQEEGGFQHTASLVSKARGKTLRIFSWLPWAIVGLDTLGVGQVDAIWGALCFAAVCAWRLLLANESTSQAGMRRRVGQRGVNTPGHPRKLIHNNCLELRILMFFGVFNLIFKFSARSGATTFNLGLWGFSSWAASLLDDKAPICIKGTFRKQGSPQPEVSQKWSLNFKNAKQLLFLRNIRGETGCSPVRPLKAGRTCQRSPPCSTCSLLALRCPCPSHVGSAYR